MFINSIKVRNFRKFEEFQVRLGERNLFVGPNNSGKSSLLDTLRILYGILRFARRQSPRIEFVPEMQQDFVSTLMDSITTGIGQLVDSDMTRESTRLQALQAQQQLGIQSLSIANSSSQQILKLFGG